MRKQKNEEQGLTKIPNRYIGDDELMFFSQNKLYSNFESHEKITFSEKSREGGG